MRLAVVGYGSVGRRHAANALAIGCGVHLIRSRATGNDLGLPETESLEDPALAGIDAVVVATPTARHTAALAALQTCDVPVLCEKPLCATAAQASQLRPWVIAKDTRWRVALQLRYHPLVERMHEWLAEGRIGRVLHVQCVVGQYLPDWRPHRPHLETYSASRGAGGGVVLDLVHEVDLAATLSGPWCAPARGFSARVGDVTVDADDVADLMWRSTNGTLVHVHLDYLFRGLRRESVVTGERGALRLDLARHVLIHTGEDGAVVEQVAAEGFERNQMFRAMLQEFLKGVEAPARCRLPTAAEHLLLQDLLWPFVDNDPAGGPSDAR